VSMGNPSRNDDLGRFWALDPAVIFLNHGSFGACPLPVLEAQQRLRERIEREPVRFFVRELQELLDAARQELAAFVGADPGDLVFVPNATYAVNSVLRSLPLNPGDELLTTDHEYNACKNALEFAASRSNARVVTARVPFPLRSPQQAVAAVLDSVTPRTRLALIDHVTSQTGLVFPVAELVAELAKRGVEVMVDGAHAPGMLPLDTQAVGAAFYTGNCHKWLCAPKGAAFLVVRPDLQRTVRPLAISHGANLERKDRSRYWLEFDYTGTDDPTPFLCVPEAIRFMGSLLPGGWSELLERNRALALRARDILIRALGCDPPCPDSMIGSLASVPIPDGSPLPPASPLYCDPIQDQLFHRYQIEVPVIPWPRPPKRLLRVSAQVYNHPQQFVQLADALKELLSQQQITYR
jgi:isopenicillin-N epimerase